MIAFDNVTKFRFESGRRKELVLKNFSATFEPNRSLGILCESAELAASLTNTFYGSERPQKGRVKRGGGLSWPLPYRGLYHGTMSGYQNLRFVADLFDRDPREVVEIVEEVSELGGYLTQPFGEYLPAIRTRFRFSVWYAMNFETYLIGNFTSVGDPDFRDRSTQLLKEMSERSTFLVISESPKPILEYCQHGAILQRGKIVPKTSLDALLDHHFDRQSAEAD